MPPALVAELGGDNYRVKKHETKKPPLHCRTNPKSLGRSFILGGSDLLKSCACKHCLTSNMCTMGWLSQDRNGQKYIKMYLVTKDKIPHQ